MASSGDLGHDPGEDLLEHDDLEQYGVWVKTAPEDVDEDNNALDPVEDVDSETSPLTAEEEELLAPLESDSQQENPETASDEFADINLDDIEDISLDDLDESDGVPLEGSPVLSQDDSDDVDFDVDALDLDLDDLEVETAAASDEESDEPEVTLDLDDIDLDDIDLADLEGPTSEGSSVEEGVASSDAEADAEEDLTDFDLEDISLADDSQEIEIEEEPDSSESLPELELEEDELSLELIEEGDPSEDPTEDDDDLHTIDDIAAVESEMTDTEEFDVEDISADTAAPVQASAMEESILAKIEGELSSIKRELTDLRSELSILRSRNAELEASTPQGGATAVAEPSDDEGDSGFFEDEDEDETIALTGAELDNILNTAEFTEEDGQPDVIDDAEIELASEPARDSVSEDTAEEAAEADDELLDLEIEEPAEDIGIGGETLEPELADDDEGDDGGFVDLELDEPGIADDSETEGTVEDFEATLGYADQVAAAPTVEERAQSAQMGDSLVERESEPVEEEINLGLEEDEDIIPLDSDAMSTPTEAVDFEDAVDEDDGAAIEEIELEELEEDEIEPVEDDATEDVPSLDEVEEEPIPDVPSLDEVEDEPEAIVPSLDEVEEPTAFEVEGEGALPDLDIDAELAEIGELSDEPDETVDTVDVPPAAQPVRPEPQPTSEPVRSTGPIGDDLKSEIRSVLSYMDQLLESLPEEKIEEFARSEHFEVYRKLFEELGLER